LVRRKTVKNQQRLIAALRALAASIVQQHSLFQEVQRAFLATHLLCNYKEGSNSNIETQQVQEKTKRLTLIATSRPNLLLLQGEDSAALRWYPSKQFRHPLGSRAR
jgi:hypothetical protein